MSWLSWPSLGGSKSWDFSCYRGDFSTFYRLKLWKKSPSNWLFYLIIRHGKKLRVHDQQTTLIAGFVYHKRDCPRFTSVFYDGPSWGWQLKYTWDIGCKRRLQTYRNGRWSWYFFKNLSMTRRSSSSMKAPKWFAKCGEPCVLSSPKPDWANCGDLRRATSGRNSCGCLVRSLRNHLLVTSISCMTSTKTSSMDGVPIRFRYSKSQGRRHMSCKTVASSKHGLAITVFLHHLAEHPSCAMFEWERQVHNGVPINQWE